MNNLETFFEETQFDNQIQEALAKEIIFSSKSFEGKISGFGLYTSWTIDSSPSEFWIISLLTPEGEEELEEEEMYATGSWDGFDQPSDPEASAITDRIYQKMWEVYEKICATSQDENRLDIELNQFYEAVKIRCAKLLVKSIPLITEYFDTAPNLFISIAEHDEIEEAMTRIKSLETF